MDLESSTAEVQLPVPQSSGSNATASDSTSGSDVAPPSPSQRKTALDSNPLMATTESGDSPPLPKLKEDFLNDGIADQISRRAPRARIVMTALTILAVFTVNLTGIVGTLGFAFYQALKPENIAKFAAAELREKINKDSSGPTEKSNTPSKSEKAPTSSDKEPKPSNAKSTNEHAPVKENGPIKVEANIYGEIRDSMGPLVALVSILAVAIVVILGTMLKATFAPYLNNSPAPKEKEETSPVPLIEALKGLVDSVKAAWK